MRSVAAVFMRTFIYGRTAASAVLAHHADLNFEITIFEIAGVVMGDVVVVLTTVPTGGKGQEIAQTLVEERLAACVNVLAPMTSTYRWRGAVERESEHQMIIKTTLNRVPAVQTALPRFIRTKKCPSSWCCQSPTAARPTSNGS